MRAQRLLDRAPDAAVGEPRVAAALGDRRPHRGVRRARRAGARRGRGSRPRAEPRPCSSTTSGAVGSVEPCRRDHRLGRSRAHRTSSSASGTSSPAVRTPAPAAYVAGQVEALDGRGVGEGAPLGAGQHPHHLELVAVRVLAVDALGGTVARLAGVGVELGQREAGLLELVDRVDLPGEVVEPQLAAGAAAAGRRPRTGRGRGGCPSGGAAGRRRSRGARAPSPSCRTPGSRSEMLCSRSDTYRTAWLRRTALTVMGALPLVVRWVLGGFSVGWDVLVRRRRRSRRSRRPSRSRRG